MKLKGYHITDEQSYEYLREELKERGYSPLPYDLLIGVDNKYLAPSAVWDVYILETEDKKWIWTRGEPSSKYEIIEYEKAEPKFYAIIKGGDLLMTFHKYWSYLPDHGLKIDGAYSDKYVTRMTKKEWKKLGIDETVADFKE